MAEGSPPWRVLGKRRIYASEWINVDFWSVRLPDGTVVDDYTVLDYPQPAVAVLPIGADGRVLMIDHYRFITDTRGGERAAGGDRALRRFLDDPRPVPSLERIEQPAVSREDRARSHAAVGSDGYERDDGAPVVRAEGDPRAAARQRDQGRTLPHWTQLGHRAGYPGPSRVAARSAGRREEVEHAPLRPSEDSRDRPGPLPPLVRRHPRPHRGVRGPGPSDRRPPGQPRLHDLPPASGRSCHVERLRPLV